MSEKMENGGADEKNRIFSWNKEAELKDKVKILRPGEGGGQEIKFESPEEIEKNNTKLENRVVELGKQLNLTKNPREKFDISREILNLVAGRSGEVFSEAKRQQANT